MKFTSIDWTSMIFTWSYLNLLLYVFALWTDDEWPWKEPTVLGLIESKCKDSRREQGESLRSDGPLDQNIFEGCTRRFGHERVPWTLRLGSHDLSGLERREDLYEDDSGNQYLLVG